MTPAPAPAPTVRIDEAAADRETGTPASEHAAGQTLAATLGARIAATGRAPRGGAATQSGVGAALFDTADEGEANGEGWLITYLDMITLLLVMMVVMLAFAGAMRGPRDTGNDAAQPARSAAPVELPPLPLEVRDAQPPPTAVPDLGDDIEVLVNERSISFRISSEILFDSGQADLSVGGLALLRRLLPVLRQSSHPVAVHGHTDPLPIRSARFPSNWELSSARAGSVVRYLEANGIDKQRLRAVGFADTRPLVDNAGAEGRAQNRRVELVLEQPGA